MDTKRMWALAASFAMMMSAGCATGEIGGGESTTCRSDDDCAEGLVCNRIDGACFAPGGGGTDAGDDDTGGNGGGGDPDSGSGGGGEVDMGSGGGGEVDMGSGGGGEVDMGSGGGGEVDMGSGDPDACNPGCGFNESCVDGQCVPDNTPCDPPCESPGFCDNGLCMYPACAQEGDLCDANNSNQGAFYCLTDVQAQEARCFAKCDELYTPSSCSEGKFCLDPVQGNSSIQVCFDSACSVDSDCSSGGQTGTCVEFSNGFGTCYPDGTVAVGSACNTANTSTSCVNGAVCDTNGSGSAGTCRRTCDPWARTSDCGAGERCTIFSARTGVCEPVADPTGTEANATCSSPGSYCADGVRCFGTGNQGFCYQYCRPDQAGTGDCGGSTEICNSYVFAGDRELGICLLRCTDDQVCGNGSRCVSNQCRNVCTTGDPVVDCCGGNTPCEWNCVNNLCE